MSNKKDYKKIKSASHLIRAAKLGRLFYKTKTGDMIESGLNYKDKISIGRIKEVIERFDEYYEKLFNYKRIENAKKFKDALIKNKLYYECGSDISHLKSEHFNKIPLEKLADVVRYYDLGKYYTKEYDK